MAVDDLVSVTFNVDEFDHIPSVKYRTPIATLCKKLKSIGNATFISLYVIQDQLSSNVWLTNHYTRAIVRDVYNPSWIFAIRELFDRCRANGYYLYDQKLTFKSPHSYNVSMQAITPCDPTFTILRGNHDCSFLATCLHQLKEVKSKKEFYQEYLEAFEDFLCYFLDSSIDILVEYMPQLKNKEIITSQSVRHDVIQHARPMAVNQLYAGEIEVLYWTAKGKTSEQIANITDYTTATVATYRQRAIKKLKAKNITQAVYIAKETNLLP